MGVHQGSGVWVRGGRPTFIQNLQEEISGKGKDMDWWKWTSLGVVIVNIVVFWVNLKIYINTRRKGEIDEEYKDKIREV